MDLYIDIETIPSLNPAVRALAIRNVRAPVNYKDEQKIADYLAEASDKAIDKTALRPEGEIVCICFAVDDEPVVSLTRKDDNVSSERDLLSAWLEYMRDLSKPGKPVKPRIIGHNVIGFDIPRLYQRCIVNNLMEPYWLPPPWNLSRWSPHSTVLDTMYTFSPDPLLSLEMMATMMGIPMDYPQIRMTFKDVEELRPVTGADIFDLWKQGEDDVIARYCTEDVNIVRQIAERIK